MPHGNPTWSFLYRHLIGDLADEYRCIAPDPLGFGLSDRARDWSYRVRDHAAVVERFLDELWLSGVTLFVHDWGGPIGANYATENPGAVDSFLVMNTAMWPIGDVPRAPGVRQSGGHASRAATRPAVQRSGAAVAARIRRPVAVDADGAAPLPGTAGRPGRPGGCAGLRAGIPTVRRRSSRTWGSGGTRSRGNRRWSAGE